jgi:hypothetical protein
LFFIYNSGFEPAASSSFPSPFLSSTTFTFTLMCQFSRLPRTLKTLSTRPLYTNKSEQLVVAGQITFHVVVLSVFRLRICNKQMCDSSYFVVLFVIDFSTPIILVKLHQCFLFVFFHFSKVRQYRRKVRIPDLYLIRISRVL